MMKVIAIHKNLALGGAEKILIDYAKQFQKENKVFDILLIENNIEFDKHEIPKAVCLQNNLNF